MELSSSLREFQEVSRNVRADSLFFKGGNTKKLAQHIADGVNGVPGVDVVVKSTQEVTKEDFVNAAGVIAGSPVYFGSWPRT